MQTFIFYLDKKVTTWYREEHLVEAETLQDAQKIMINNFADDDTDETFDSQEEMLDTWEELTPEENNGQPTREVWCEDSQLFLIDNVANQPMI